jgi:hypothetical protein
MARHPSLSDRFKAKIVDGPNGCKDWPGTGRYGTIKDNGKDLRINRVAWELVNGPIPAGLHVLHRCDRTKCVAVEHLFLGTHAENMADMAIKGRSKGPRLSGERHPMAKLNTLEVERIRTFVGPLKQIAKALNVSVSLVSAIRLGKVWNSITSRHLQPEIQP